MTASTDQVLIVRAIGAGAAGYLQQCSGKEQLLVTLREVALGEFRIPGSAAGLLARSVRSPWFDGTVPRLDCLAARESEYLRLFASGVTYQEIADTRDVSALTVRNAVSSAQRKLGFSNRQQL